MKKQTTNQFSPISTEQTENLTTVVKETIALGLSKVRTFSTDDMWNIKSRRRQIISRRNFV